MAGGAPWISRQLQREVLQQLGQADPEWVPVGSLRLFGAGGGELTRNLIYLHRAGLIECDTGPGGAVSRMRLQPLGRAFLVAADLADEPRQPIAPTRYRAGLESFP